MPTTVLLIRHPESAWNRTGTYQGQMDIPLSPLGWVQAELVAARLSRQHIHGIACSPLRRAHTLAQAIGRYHHLAPQSDDRLTEIGHGEWEGLTRDQIRVKYPAMYALWTERPHEVTFPGGESLQAVHDPSVPAIAELLARPGDETWVVVTHDTICRLAVAAARRQPVAGFAAVGLENAGITTLVGPDLESSVVSVNDVEHLGEHRVNLEIQAL